MTRKIHLSKNQGFGPACQSGRIGGNIRGEHIALDFAAFKTATANGAVCSKCAASPLFAFLTKQEAKTAKQEEAPSLDWEPETGDWWENDKAKYFTK